MRSTDLHITLPLNSQKISGRCDCWLPALQVENLLNLKQQLKQDLLEKIVSNIEVSELNA